MSFGPFRKKKVEKSNKAMDEAFPFGRGDLESMPISDLAPDIMPPLEKPSKIEKEISMTDRDKISKKRVDFNPLILCEKIEDETGGIKRKFNRIKRTKDLNIDSLEMIDLIRLHGETSKKLKNFIDRVDDADSSGWNVERNIASFYKYRACKGLANLKKELKDMERVSEGLGFTTTKIENILSTPAKKLVEDLGK